MRTATLILSGFLMLASGSLATVHAIQVASQCPYAGREYLNNSTVLCHYSCPGRDVPVAIKIPNGCPRFISI